MNEEGKRKHPFLGIKITDKENELVQDCQHIQFWYRAFPMALAGGSIMLAAGIKGHIKPIPYLSHIPATLFGSGTGYLLGNMSYSSTFVERFINEQPNSNVTRIFRQRLSEGKGYVMSLEELTLSVKCQKEAFWQRCVPLTLIFASSMGFLIRKDLVSAKFRIPKILIFSMIGYEIGRISYRPTKMEKFLRELPDGNISRDYRRTFGLKVSDEEIFALSECLRQGVLAFSLPLSFLNGFTVYKLIQKGKLKMNQRFGIWPKTLPAMMFGFALGYYFNHLVCAQQMLQNHPDSLIVKEYWPDNVEEVEEQANEEANEDE